MKATIETLIAEQTAWVEGCGSDLSGYVEHYRKLGVDEDRARLIYDSDVAELNRLKGRTRRQTATKRATKRAQPNELQFMEAAAKLAVNEVPIVRGVVEEAAKALFCCDYETFFSHAEQALAYKPQSCVAFMIENALAKFPYR